MESSVASGGTVKIANGLVTHTFDKAGSYTFKVTSPIKGAKMWLVGAGSSGQSAGPYRSRGSTYFKAGRGGNGGEVKSFTNIDLPVNNYAVSVGSGKGGAGGPTQFGKSAPFMMSAKGGAVPEHTEHDYVYHIGGNGANGRGSRVRTYGYNPAGNYYANTFGANGGSGVIINGIGYGGGGGSGVVTRNDNSPHTGIGPDTYAPGLGRDGGGNGAVGQYNYYTGLSGSTAASTAATTGVRGGGGGGGGARTPRNQVTLPPSPGGDGVVIIQYTYTPPPTTTPAPTTPAPTTTPPPGPSQEDIDRLVREYEAKMAQLQAAAAAEKQALIDQNAAAAEQARQLQEGLIRDLTALKQQYDQLKAAAAAAEQELQNTKQGMDQIKVEYDQKMVQLAEAQRKELEAIASQNGAAMEAARIEKERLIAEMKALKIQYDTAVVISQQCPIIPEKTILVDGKSGQMYRYEAGMLRGMSVDTYRALGSPGYTTYKSGTLDNCPRGPDIQHQTVTPKPTDAPTEAPAFPSTVYVIIHGESWSMKGEMRVLASRFGGAVIEPFAFKDLAQVFAINSAGYIRSLEGQGLYLTSQDDCLSAVMMKDVPKAGWRLQKTGDSQYGYQLISPCSVSLKAGVADRSPVLEQSAFGDEASDAWYVLPIGKMEL